MIFSMYNQKEKFKKNWENMNQNTSAKNEFSPSLAASLFVKDGHPQFSYLCGEDGTAAAKLINDSLLNLAKDGHGALADLVSVTPKEIAPELKDILHSSSRNLFVIDLAAKKFPFNYDPFHGKNVDECGNVAVGLLGIHEGMNVGAEHFASIASVYIRAVIDLHFEIYDSFAFSDLVDYFCTTERLHIEIEKIKSFGNDVKDFTPHTKWAEAFYSNDQFNYKLFVQNLGGFVGNLNMLRSEYKGLFDAVDAEKPTLNLKDAFRNNDVIMIDTSSYKDDRKSVGQFLKRLVAADATVTIRHFLINHELEKVFALLLNKNSIVPQELIAHVVTIGRKAKLALQRQYCSYEDFKKEPFDFRNTLTHNTHYKIIFSEKPQTDEGGLTAEQLEMKNKLNHQEFMVIHQGETNVLEMK